ncbi:MAG: M6 family metalloprotease domain-containing protein [Bacteroidota bacterium]
MALKFKHLPWLGLVLLFSLLVYNLPKEELSPATDHVHVLRADDNSFCGIPPAPEPTLLEQPDGTTFLAYLRLQDGVVYLESTDGYTIMQDPNDDVYRFVSRGTGGNLALTDLRATDEDARSSTTRRLLDAIPPHLRYSGKKLAELEGSQRQKRLNDGVGGGVLNAVFPSTGIQRTLLLLIDFPDQLHGFSVNDFDRLANEEGYSRNGASGSFRDYYLDISYGELTVNTEVFGWYTSANNRATYGVMDLSNRDFSGGPRLVREAVDAAEAAGVDFSNYDGDNDGRVDVVEVIHSGRGAEESGNVADIWSHRWGLGSSAVTYDGKRINDYIIQAEKYRNNTTITNIGVLVHEFGHALGLPDLYDINGGSAGIGRWCCMAGGTWNNNGRTPAHFSGWCKERLGWITPEVLTGTGSVSGIPPSESSPDSYRFNTNLSNEYFLLENRKKEGWDRFIPGEGLMIYHIDANKFSNADEDHRLVDIEQADGRRDLNDGSNSGDNGDPYPGTSGNRTFACATTPNTGNYNGGFSNLSVTNIQLDGELAGFDYNFCTTDCLMENIELAEAPSDSENGIYDVSVVVSYDFAPSSGTLDVTAAGTTTSVPITGSPQTVGLTDLPADGESVTVTATFSAETDCSITINNLYRAPRDCANDDFCSALDITAAIDGRPVSCSNVGATVQANEPRPAFVSGGCTRQDAWCDNTLHNTVWFKFTAPASGSIDLDFISENDMQLAIWETHGNCGSLDDADGPLLVAANDDSGTGGGFSPRIADLRCLVPGKVYYVQVDGYDGATHNFTFNITDPGLTCGVAPTANANCTGVEARTSLGTGTWRHFTDAAGNCIASVNDRFNDLGELDLSYSVTSEEMRLDEVGYPLLNRDWFISAANNGGANVRLYLTDAEYQEFVAAGGAADLDECILLKVNGGDCGNLIGTSNNLLQAVSSKMNFSGDNHMVEFRVDGFSGFFPRADAVVLPVEFSYVRGRIVGKTNLLEWETAREEQTARHEVERLVRGENTWETLGQLTAAGVSETSRGYSWTDESPLPEAYYRIRTVDIDGSYQYSEVVTLLRPDEGAFLGRIYPNPAVTDVTAELYLPKAAEINWTLLDARGRTVNQGIQSASGGRKRFSVDLRGYASGLYFLRVRYGTEEALRKLLKQ